jgi:hypothetical protein
MRTSADMARRTSTVRAGGPVGQAALAHSLNLCGGDGWPIPSVFARVVSWCSPMPQGSTRHYVRGDLHFVSFSCYHRTPFLKSPHPRNAFVEILGQVRDRYEFLLLGYVVMPHPPSSRLSALPAEHFRHARTSSTGHFEWSRPTFSSPFVSREWVGLRRKKSLFDRATSANC